jgi:NADH-quinone oxidoreductase subunit E
VNEILSKYKDEVERILAKYPSDFKRSAVMPLLYLAQRDEGYVRRKALAEIADILEMSSTEVASVAGFYSLYYEAPHGKFHIQICNDLPCAMRGADVFLQQVCDYLGVKVGETSADGLFTVEAVKCLAACHRAPMFQVQGHDGGDPADYIAYHEDQTLETAIAWIEQVRAARQPEPQSSGPQSGAPHNSGAQISGAASAVSGKEPA